jgi:ribonuclease HI
MRATVITDASYCHQKKAGGWAAWVRIDGYPAPIKGYGSLNIEARNSTEAEVMGALNGLWLAATRGSTGVLVRCDCMTVQDLIQGKPMNAEYLFHRWRNALSAPWASRLRHISSRHVKGHANPNRHAAGWVNNWADTHARKGMQAARKKRKLLEIDG